MDRLVKNRRIKAAKKLREGCPKKSLMFFEKG